MFAVPVLPARSYPGIAAADTVPPFASTPRSSAAAVVEIIRCPREFTATLRVGDAVQEKAAGPREDVELEQVTLWFSDTEAGSAHREHIRRNLTAGRLVDLNCHADVGLDARPLPDRFRQVADPDGSCAVAKRISASPTR